MSDVKPCLNALPNATYLTTKLVIKTETALLNVAIFLPPVKNRRQSATPSYRKEKREQPLRCVTLAVMQCEGDKPTGAHHERN